MTLGLNDVCGILQNCATMAVGPFYQQYFTDWRGLAIPDKQGDLSNIMLKTFYDRVS